jgi:hypothetical protein
MQAEFQAVADDDDLLIHPMRSTPGLPTAAEEEAGTHNSDDDDVLPDQGTARDDDDDDEEFAREIRDRRVQAELQAVRRGQATDVQLKQMSSGANKRQIVPLSSASASSARRGSSSGTPGSGRASVVTDAARLIALDEECRSMQKIMQAQEKTIARLAAESEKQAKLIGALNQKVDKEVATHREMEQKLRIAEVTISTQKKEILLLQRGGAAGVVDSVSGDVRLQKANEEIARLRKELAAATTPGSSSEAADQIVTLRAENKRLDAQRVELLGCIRKQNKLIDVLKRQKLHLEAAKLISMTEEEFTKILEINQK